MDGIMAMIMACSISVMNRMAVPKWNPRPAYYHMYFFQKMLGDRLVSSTSNTSAIVTYASSFTSGETAVALINKSSSAATVQVMVKNFRKGNSFYYYRLNGGTDNGEFSRNVLVNGNSIIAMHPGARRDIKHQSLFGTATVNGIV